MPGCNRISGSLQITIHTVLLIKTIKDLSSDLHWCSWNIISTQDHNVAGIACDESTAVFSWKGESLKKYWEWILNNLIWTYYYGKVCRPDLIFDDGGVIWIFSSVRVRRRRTCFSSMVVSLTPAPLTILNSVFSKNIINLQLEGGDKDEWNKISNTCVGFSEVTSAEVHRL